jgi:starch synthase
MNILYAASEARPFIATGGLADVAGALPKQLCKVGHDARVVLPFYSKIPKDLRQNLKSICYFAVPVSWRQEYCEVFERKIGDVTHYLLYNTRYFMREFPSGIYGEYDKCEQFAFFSRAVLEMLRYIVDWKPQIINCNDWQTALIPVFLKLYYKHLLKDMKTVYTIHNILFQGLYSYEVLNDVLGVPADCTGLMEYDGCVNLMKAALETADKITTVSQSYSKEIVESDDLSHKLNRILVTKRNKLTGVVNGIDVDKYNPETDTAIAKNYSIDDLSGKRECKKALLDELKLADGNEPLIGMVGRLSFEKGHELIKDIFETMVADGFKFAILGKGDSVYEEFYRYMAWKYPKQVSAAIAFDNNLAQKIYAAADMIMMPSLSEPCGLAQLISLRYGTVPIVRNVGGLKDTIHNVDENGEGGNGFVFENADSKELLEAIYRARKLYDDRENWENLMRYGMSLDHSWKKSTGLYLGLYRELVG